MAVGTSSAGTVTVDFDAQVAKFNKQMSQVQGSLDHVSKSLESVGEVAKQALEFLAVGEFARFVKEAGEAADAAAKMADKLGVGTKQLAAFQLAAELAGTPVESLNKLLVDAQRHLGEAATTLTGTTFDALKLLGLNIRELQTLSPDQLFLRYADALDKVRNRSEQFALAQALFGRTATEAFNLIEAGRPAIEKAAADVENYGLALTRVDAAKIEAANDAITRLDKANQAFAQHVAAAFAPFTEEIARRLTETTGAANKAQSEMQDFAQASFIAFEIVANAARVFDITVSAAFLAISEGVQLVIGAVQKALELTASLDKSLGLDALSKKFSEFATVAGNANAFAGDLSEEAKARIKAAADGIKSFAQIIDESNRLIQESQANAEAAAARVQENNSSLGRVSDVQIENATATNALLEELQKAHFSKLLDMQSQFQKDSDDLLKRLTAANEKNIRERAELAIAAQQRIRVAEEDTAIASVGLIAYVSSAHGKASKALAAAQKAQALIAVYRNTAQAASLAIANIPPPYGFIAAAANIAFGLIQAESIIAERPPGGGAGTPSNDVFSSSSNQGGTTTPGAQQPKQVQIIVEGVITPGSARAIADALKDVIDNSDVHIIGENSSQAELLRAA